MPNPKQELRKANIGWMYYKRYYQLVDFSKPDKNPVNEAEMSSMNDTIVSNVETELCMDAFNKVPTKPSNEKLLVTTYPGLLSGSGYTHETNRLGETKIGFFFDHVTGLPCLPGHSVKGKIRSAFPQWKNDKVKYQAQKQDYIMDFLKNTSRLDTSNKCHKYLLSLKVSSVPNYSDRLFMTMLENIIFEGLQPKIADGEWQKKNNEYIYESVSIYKRDIFHDAYISRKSNDTKILGMDAITPHKHPLKNPIPLAFIKVLPDVTWSFQFNLKDNILDSKDKLKLFYFLLEEFGIGAKTNVGYGQFI